MMADRPLHQKGKASPRRGRPRASERLVPITTWIHPDDRDRLSQIARRHRQSESSWLRQVVIIQLREP